MISARAKAALAAAKRRGVKLGGDRGRLTAKARLGGNAAQRAKAQARAAWGTPATVAAKNASGTIPIVMTSTADPFAVVGHIARPGGNVTGMASLLVDLTSKRLALLTEIVPGLARVGILSNPDNPNYARTRKNYETAAQSLGMQLVLFDARTPEDIAAAFVAAGRQRPDALSARDRNGHPGKSKPHRRPSDRAPAASGLRLARVRRCWRIDRIRRELSRPLSPRGDLRRQNLQGC